MKRTVNQIHKKKLLTALKLAGLLLLIVLSTAIITKISASPDTTIYIDPSSTTVAVGQTFFIEIKISDVYDLYGWEFKLSWNPNLLDVIEVTEGEFLKRGGDTFFYPKTNNTAGYILVDCTLLGNVPGVSGNGTLATVQFYAETEGTSTLDLYDTILINSSELSIIHTTTDGTVEILPAVHDIAIIDVAPTKTSVGQGLTQRIMVTIENQGGYTETFDVSVYYNATNLIATQSVTLSGGSSVIIVFVWDTIDVAKGVYILSAAASVVPGEVDTADNAYVNRVILVAMKGDISGPTQGVPDGQVDIRDIAMVAKAYGSYPGDPYWDPNADVNDDDMVDIKDIAIVAKNYGKIDP